jgi:hypothetical protein
VDRPHNAPSFVFSTASSTPKRNDDDEASHGVSHAPQGELILLIFLRGDGTRHGRTRGTTGYRFLSFQSHFVCLVPISFRQFSSDFKFAFKSFCGCNTECWFDRLRHIFFGMVKSSQGTPCNNGIRSASPHGLRITYHAPLSSSSVDVKYHLKYPYVTCRFVQ